MSFLSPLRLPSRVYSEKSKYTLRRHSVFSRNTPSAILREKRLKRLWEEATKKQIDNGQLEGDCASNSSLDQQGFVSLVEGSEPHMSSVRDDALNSSAEAPEIGRSTFISIWDEGKFAWFESELSLLKERVSNLEKKDDMFNKLTRTLTRGVTYEDSFATKGDDGMGGMWTCLELVRSKKVALLQCIWLLLCVTLFIAFGTYLLVNAYFHENTSWKSERIDYTIDYTGEDLDRQYQMPYVYLFFEVGMPTNAGKESLLYSEKINQTLQKLLESQNYFVNRTGILWMSDMEKIDDIHEEHSTFCEVEAEAHFTDWSTEDWHLGYFRVKLNDPEVGKEWVHFWLNIDADALTRNGSIPINGFYIYIGRSLKGINFLDALLLHTGEAFSEKAFLSFSIEYTEKVTRRIGTANLNQFELSLDWWDSMPYTSNSSTSSIIDIRVTTDLKVEHWEEWVEYGYTDWLAAMGGLFSIFTFIFFQVGYVIAVVVGKGYTMGILPELSFTFSNLEMVHLVKEFYYSKKLTCDLVDQINDEIHKVN